MGNQMLLTCGNLLMGYAQTLKTLTSQAQRRWLDDDASAEKCYGHDKYFTSKKRWILITLWIGEAYEKLTCLNMTTWDYECGRRPAA